MGEDVDPTLQPMRTMGTSKGHGIMGGGGVVVAAESCRKSGVRYNKPLTRCLGQILSSVRLPGDTIVSPANASGTHDGSSPM